MNGPLKTISMLLILGLSGCSALGRLSSLPPATREDLQNESQRLHELMELQHKQLTQQQTELTAQFAGELKELHTAINELNGTMHSLHTAKPATIVIKDEDCPAPPPGQTADGKLLLGEAEWLWLDDVKQAFRARIDTGAKTSSISAEEISHFERNGKDWVRFFMNHKGKEDRVPIEAPLVRHVRVRQASAEELDRRPVVRLSVWVGDQKEKTEFTLTDRSDMKYPVLLGRDFLKDIAVVDVGRKFIQPKPLLKDVR